jgi:tetratricopeptide (TPR) repeat protein
MMRLPIPFLSAVLTSAALLLSAMAAGAQDEAARKAREDALFAELLGEHADWERIEREVLALWSQSGSDAMDLLLERGRFSMEMGDLDGAIGHFTALTGLAPDFAEGWNARATAFFLAGDYGLSIADVERTLALNPRHFGALSGLGIMLEAMGRNADALDAYLAAQALHPHRENVNEAVSRLERLLSDSVL